MERAQNALLLRHHRPAVPRRPESRHHARASRLLVPMESAQISRPAARPLSSARRARVGDRSGQDEQEPLFGRLLRLPLS